MLADLVSNALRFTPEGGTVRLAAGWGPGEGMTITVSDTGVGIAPDDLARVTEPFAALERQEHTSRDRALHRDTGQTRTGLGLPLAAQIARLHGASLSIDSKVGVGTRVSVRFPASSHPAVPSDAGGPASVRAGQGGTG